MEWLYFVTKPSFLSGINAWDSIKVLLLTNSIVSFPAFCILTFLFLCDRVIAFFTIRQIIRVIAVLMPIFFIGITTLLLVDNFTYTLFRFGIVNSYGVFRGIYGISFLILLYRLYLKLFPHLRHNPSTFQRSPLLWISFFLFFLPLLLVALNNPLFFHTQTLVNKTNITKRPNIILLGSDGISARNLSLYGYSNDTTPYLKTLSSESLLMKNHMSNAGNTTGSVTSLLSGKLPSKTRVGYPPDRLRSSDAYQHLPYILSELGYKSVQIAIPHYLDAKEINMLNGFDQVNGEFINKGPLIQKMRSLFSNDVVFFLETIYERVSDRIFHIFYFRQMVNPYHIVTQTPDTGYDKGLLSELDKLIMKSEQPFFAHIHLLGTHGGLFNTDSNQFSKEKIQDYEWMTEFYDDSLLDFDGYVNRVVNSLENAGKLDKTILIIYTDHAQRWNPLERIPLMIRFPNSEFSGTITENTQNLDISPTILDYLGIPQPLWMDGQSLLHGNPAALRPIISANVERTENAGKGNKYHFNSKNPPFFQFDNFTETVCNKWVKLTTTNGEWTVGTLDSESGLCSGVVIPSSRQMEQDLLDHLKKDGFDVSLIHIDD